MFSDLPGLRQTFAFSSLLALFLSAGGCGLRIGEGVPAGTLKLNSAQETACLSGGGKIIGDFLEGTATDAQISNLWDCARRSIVLFGERTRGVRTGIYTPQELRYFLEKHFLRDFKITDGLLTEAMELKRNLLGGRTDALTTDELKQLQRLTDIFKHHCLALRPYMPLTPERLETVDHATLNQAVHALEAAAIDLGAILKGRGFQYPFGRLDQLLREIEAMFGRIEYRNRVGTLRSNLPLIRQLKALLVSPDSSQIEGGEWDSLLLSAAQGYGLVLRSAHLFKNHTDFTSGAGLASTKELFKNAHAILERAILRRPEKMIPTLELEQFIYLIRPDENELTLLGEMVPKSHLRELVRVFVQRVLGGARPGPEGRDAKGLTLAALKRASELFLDWTEGQSYLETLMKSTPSALGVESLASEVPAGEELYLAVRDRASLLQAADGGSTWLGGSFGFSGEDDSVPGAAAARLRELISWEKPYFYRDEPEIDFGKLGPSAGFTWGGLSKMHWMDLLSRLLVTAYSESSERAATGDRVDFQELERFYQDFRTVGIDIRLFDPVRTDVVKKRFLEANLFTPSADGSGHLAGGKAKGWLTVNEGRQFLAYLISGKTLASRLHNAVAGHCPAGLQQRKDSYGYDLIDAECFRENFYSRLQDYWNHFPALVAHFKRAPRVEKVAFACRIEQITRQAGFSEARIDSSDTESLGILPHYIETLFLRFDRDSSGTLDWREAIEGPESAFMIFRNTMAEVVRQETGQAPSEERLKAIFTFYLAHGRKPTKREYLVWYSRHYNSVSRSMLGDWDFQADRGSLVAVLADFSSQATEGGTGGEVIEAPAASAGMQACTAYWGALLDRAPGLLGADAMIRPRSR